jgi:hypothetical protein
MCKSNVENSYDTYVTAQPTVIQENIQMSEHKEGKHSGHEIESILGSIE